MRRKPINRRRPDSRKPPKRDVSGYKDRYRRHLHAGGPMPDFLSYGLSAEDARLYRQQVDNED